MTSAQAGIVLQHIRRLGGTAAPGQPPDGHLLEHFAAQRDGAAFAALVRRHGPMVLNVCRGVLRHDHDAEDAFQATFLVLARKAASIRQPEAVASWLYEVAHRVAVKAQVDAARRRAREQRASPMAPADPTLDMTLRDLQRVLHEELRRLPEKFRLPLALCYLEGRSQAEAADQLGWSKGTLRGRLDRGREQLRRRLAARGVTLSALLCATAVAPTTAAESLVDAVVRAAVSGAAAGAVSAKVSALADGVIRAMVTGKLKVAAAVLFVVGLVTTAACGFAAREWPVGSEMSAAKGQEPTPAAAKPQAAAEDNDSIAYDGQVLGPDGKPVAGAKLYLTQWWGYHYEPFTAPASATTGPGGRFTFTAPKAKYQDQATIVSAAAPNLGIGWVGILKDDKRTDLTLKLVADDVPITGQIVDLEGKPVPGATVRVLQIMASPAEDLGPWLEATKDKTAPPNNRSSDLEQQYLSRYTTAPQAVVTTDAAGRFRLTGIGRERLAIVQLDGPTIASEYLHIRTRPGEAFKVPQLEADPEYGTPQIDVTYYGAGFRHVAGPTRPIAGVVRDKDTKKPLAGVTVRSEKLAHNPYHGTHIVQTLTDAQGRYRLVGMPKGAGNKIQIVPHGNLPYVTPVVDVPDNFGLDPVTVDVELKRAVWIEGRVTDKVTGKSVRESVMYLVRDSNPNLGDYPGFYGGLSGIAATKEDGTYRIIGLPGPGQIVVFQQHRLGQQPQYLLGAERDDEDGLKEDFGYMPQGNFAAFARIDPPKGAESVRRDIALVPGWTFTGTVLGPDGRPLAGAVMGGHSEGMKTAEFTVRQFNPRRPRPVFFRLPEKGLIGVAHPPEENGGSVTVRMAPGAAVTGRLVDGDGTPRAGVEMHVSFRPKEEPHWNECGLHEPIKTDREGRFRIDALPPGFDYYLSADHSSVRFGTGLRAGETKDLGDVRIKRAGQ
jgi:RNA polymerase sigma factor (sigma-70 family)